MANADHSASASKNTFRVKVFSPFETFVDGLALSISAESETGPFDILASHANFLTLLVPCTLRVHTPQEELMVPIERAVLHVRDDQATVFLNI